MNFIIECDDEQQQIQVLLKTPVENDNDATTNDSRVYR